MSTLTQYWIDEASRLDQTLGAARTDTGTARLAQAAAQTQSRLAADAVRVASDMVAVARKALAGIPTPADGDPLLLAMSQALIAWHEALHAQASADLALQVAKAEVERLQALEAALLLDLTEVKAAQQLESKAALQRAAAVAALDVGGRWATLAADATQALSDAEAGARARVEGEFPTNATANKNFLARVRARRALVLDSAVQAQDVATTGLAASTAALAQAQRQFDQAWQAVRSLVDTAPRLADDRDTLVRLAALPAPHPTAPVSYPILTPAQHDELFDAGLKSAREAALVKLTAADDAEKDWRKAQSVYDKALNAALKANPAKTVADLNAAEVKTEFDDLTAKAGARTTKRNDLTSDAAAYAILQAWFAAVPDVLWDTLDQLDNAIARLNVFKGAPTPAQRLQDLAARETDLVTALSAARLATRTQRIADQAALRALGQSQAELATAARRAKAASRDTAPL